MGQTLSIAGVERLRAAIILGLHSKLTSARPQTPTSLSGYALAAFRKHDPDTCGYVSSSSLDAILKELGLADRWSRLDVDAFAHSFVVDDAQDNGACTSTRLDYLLFLGVVFYPLSCSPTLRAEVSIAQQAVTTPQSPGVTIHSGVYDGQEAIIKEVALANAREVTVEVLRRRVNVLRLVRHANLVRYKTTISSGQSLYIIHDPHATCSLRTILESFGAMKEPTIRRYASQVLEALAYLHDRGIVHGNLHLENITIDSYGLLQLSEFGIGVELAELRDDQLKDQSDWIRQFPPPETSRVAEATKAADTWRVGVLILQMMHGVGQGAAVALDEQLNGTPTRTPGVKAFKPPTLKSQPMTPPIPQTISKPLRNIVQGCLQLSARKRPSARRLLGMEFFHVDPAQETNEILRDVCSDLDASMRRLSGVSGRVSSSIRSFPAAGSRRVTTPGRQYGVK